MSVIVISILFLCNDFFTPTDNHPARRWKALHHLEKNSLDILFLGNSHSCLSFSPNIIDSYLGTNSFNLANEGLNMEQCYYNFREALNNQKPKLLVLELYAIKRSVKNDTGTMMIYANLDGYRSLSNKISAVMAFRPVSDYIPTFFSVVRYHEAWKKADEQLHFLCSYDKNHLYRGHDFVNDEMDADEKIKNKEKYIVDSLQYKNYKINEVSEKYLALIQQLAKENNIKVLYVLAPMYGEIINPYYHFKHDALQKNADKYGVDLVDFNAMNDKRFRDHRIYESKIGPYKHLNIKGTRIVSDYIKVCIKNKYGNILPNRKNEKDWKYRMSLYIENQLNNIETVNTSQKINGRISLTPKLEVNGAYILRCAEANKYNLVLDLDTNVDDSIFKNKLIYFHVYPKNEEMINLGFSPTIINVDHKKYLVREFDLNGLEIDSIHLGLCNSAPNWEAIGKKIRIEKLIIKN